MEWLNKTGAGARMCGCTCSCGYVNNDPRASLSQSYSLLHVVTPLLGKALECSYLLCIKFLIFRYSPGWFQSWRNGGGPASCSVNELTALPLLDCRTGIYLPLVTASPFLATSKCRLQTPSLTAPSQAFPAMPGLCWSLRWLLL